MQGKEAAFECEVAAGDMLYLPAGWFHEVTSFGELETGGHLAFNYWFHPPDNLDPSEAGFQQPYTCAHTTSSVKLKPGLQLAIRVPCLLVVALLKFLKVMFFFLRKSCG